LVGAFLGLPTEGGNCSEIGFGTLFLEFRRASFKPGRAFKIEKRAYDDDAIKAAKLPEEG
jgi:hypothetical protein